MDPALSLAHTRGHVAAKAPFFSYLFENTVKPAKKRTKRPAAATTARAKSKGLTPEERGALKEHIGALKSEPRSSRAGIADGERAVLAKIATFPQPDRVMGERLHAIITGTGPTLSARTWYGMPAYAKDGSVICFFQSAQMFKTRYVTLGFSDKAHLDDGNMWPTAFALQELTPAEEARIAALVKRAMG